MAEMEFKPNSHKYKAEQKAKAAADTKDRERRAEKVTTGKVVTRKKSKTSKIADSFIGEDAGNIGNYILNDVLIPSVKKAVVDIVTDGIAMLLGTDKKKRNSGSSHYVSYRSYSDDRDRNYRSSSRGYNFDEIIFETRGEAEEVLDRMDELLETYRSVSVADMYDLAGLTCDYTDNKYGWTSLRSADVVRCNGGYTLKLPRATAL